LLLFALCTIGFWLFENFYTPDSYSGDASPSNFIIDKNLLPSSTYGDIVWHNYFLLSYSEPHEQAEWVAYTLLKEHLTHDDRKRPYFIEDPRVRTKSADWRNYKRSGFDRGHLCPAGDRRFSEQAYNETFYTSNISPQDKAFNAGVWNRLEKQVRSWCKKYGALTIITGGVLKKGLQEIGSEDVDVPDEFYKLVIKVHGDEIQVLAFLFPHKETNRPLQDFLVPVDAIESATGIDFFEQLPPKKALELEQKVMAKGWSFP